MASFKNVLIRSIKKQQFDKTYYEEVIATWILKGWLTEDEATECMEVLNEVFTVTA